MKTQQDIKAMIDADREKFFEYKNGLKKAAAKLEELKRSEYDASPAQIVEKYVKAVGYDVACIVVASAVNNCAWDGRIGPAVKAWAASVENAFDEAAALNMGLTLGNIHRAHLDQTADALRRYKPENVEQPPKGKKEEKAMKTSTTKTSTSKRNETKEENSMKKYTFAPDSITVNGKTFLASYEINEHNIRIAATVAENSVVYIDVPEDDANFSEIYTMAESMARAAAYVDEMPQEQSEEQPAEEQPAEEQPAQEAPSSTDEAPQEHAEEQPAEEQPAQEAPSSTDEAPQEQPAADPKQARGPVPEKAFAGESITGRGWSIVFDTGMQRTRVIISDPIREKAVPIIENAGFYYSRPMNSYNKKLTFRAYRAALALADKLRAALA